MSHNPEGNWSRARAFTLLEQYNESASLRKHALGLETCIRAYGEQAVEVPGCGNTPGYA